jgi:hypothetical protein
MSRLPNAEDAPAAPTSPATAAAAKLFGAVEHVPRSHPPEMPSEGRPLRETEESEVERRLRM